MDLVKSSHIKHAIYASKIWNSVANVQDLSNKMYLYGNPRMFKNAVSDIGNIKKTSGQPYLMALVKPAIFKTNGTFAINIKWSAFNKFFIKKIIYSNPVVSIHKILADFKFLSNSNSNKNDLIKMVAGLYNSIKDGEMFLLKQHHIGVFPKTALLSFYEIYAQNQTKYW